MAITSRGQPLPECSLVAPSDTIVGSLVAKHGSIATFSIESVEPRVVPSLPSDAGPALAPGRTVAVRFHGSLMKYLSLGYRYQVAVYWSFGRQFSSHVPLPDVDCQGPGIRYADLRAIDVPSPSRSWVRSVSLACAGGAIVVIACGLVIRSLRARRLRVLG